MTNNNDNLVLEHLRYIRKKVDATDTRVQGLEHGLVSLRHDIHASERHSIRHDSDIMELKDRLAQIEKRLEIIDQPPH